MGKSVKSYSDCWKDLKELMLSTYDDMSVSLEIRQFSEIMLEIISMIEKGEIDF